MPGKRPPVGINPNLDINVQRELRKVAQYAFDAQQTANEAKAGLSGKLNRTQEDLLQISQFVSGQIQANGAHPTNLTGLPLGPSGVKAGTYTIGAVKITVNSSGQITNIQ